MIKKLLFSLFLLLTLGLINFSSAGSFTYTGTITRSIYSSSETSDGFFNYNLPVPVSGVSKGGSFNFICDFSNFNLGNIVFTSVQGSYSYSQGNNIASNKFCSTVPFSTSNNNFSCGSLNSNAFLVYSTIRFYYSRPNTDTNISFDFSCTFTGTNIINKSDIGSCGNNGGSSTCESDLLSCQSSLSTLSGNLSICQSDLLNCQNNSFTQEECNLLYSGYVSPTLYQNCTNSLNSCSGELGVCNSSLNSCLNGNYTGGNWSSIWINNIQHLGNKNIFLTIPTEIEWDYFYTGEDMNIAVEGYNVDTEYIEGVINNQSTLPNQVDLNNIIKNVLPLFVPGLVIILFIYFVFRFIKKIF